MRRDFQAEPLVYVLRGQLCIIVLWQDANYLQKSEEAGLVQSTPGWDSEAHC